MAVAIMLSNQEGGVGEITSAYVLATSLKGKGYKVFAVDMDPQGNLSFAMGANVESAAIYDVLREELRPRYVVQKSASVDIIPANILLSSIELEFAGQHREPLLKEALDFLKNPYGYTLIGSPSALGILTVNVLTAADYMLVPMLSDIFSLQGITQLGETIRRVGNYCNPGIQAPGAFLTKRNSRTRFNKEVEGTLRVVANDLKMPALNTFIRESMTLRETQSFQCSASDYASGYNTTQDCENLLQESMQRGLRANS